MKLHTALLLGSFLSTIAATNSALALDCQNPQTQTVMNQCAYSELERETAKINKTITTITEPNWIQHENNNSRKCNWHG